MEGLDLIADIVLDSQTIVFAVSIGTVVFSVGIFVGTTRGMVRRITDTEKTVNEQGGKIEQLRVDLAAARMRRNGDDKPKGR